MDAHPIVRQHFGQELKQQHLGAWREGNNRLYEHFKHTTKELPESLEEMFPCTRQLLTAAMLEDTRTLLGKYIGLE